MIVTVWFVVSLFTLMILCDPNCEWDLSGRQKFWITAFAPWVLLFLIGWGLARLLGYLFYLRKEI